MQQENDKIDGSLEEPENSTGYGYSRRGLSTMPKYHYEICDRFRLCRLEECMTIKEFSEVMGLTISYVKNLEAKAYTPNIYAIMQMHKVFGCSYEWILEGKGRRKVISR